MPSIILSIPARIARWVAAATLPLAAALALVTMSPASTVQAKELVARVEATNNSTGYSEAPGVFTITLSKKQDKPVTVLYSVNGNPVNGVDYNRVSGMKVIKAGTIHGLVRIVATKATENRTGDGIVYLSLRSGKGYKVGKPQQASIQIVEVIML